jgi:hypothetical protein
LFKLGLACCSENDIAIIAPAIARQNRLAPLCARLSYWDVWTDFLERAHEAQALVATLKHQQLRAKPALDFNDLKAIPRFQYDKYAKARSAGFESSSKRQDREPCKSAAGERNPSATIDHESSKLPAEGQDDQGSRNQSSPSRKPGSAGEKRTDRESGCNNFDADQFPVPEPFIPEPFSFFPARALLCDSKPWPTFVPPKWVFMSFIKLVVIY